MQYYALNFIKVNCDRANNHFSKVCVCFMPFSSHEMFSPSPLIQLYTPKTLGKGVETCHHHACLCLLLLPEFEKHNTTCFNSRILPVLLIRIVLSVLSTKMKRVHVLRILACYSKENQYFCLSPRQLPSAKKAAKHIWLVILKATVIFSTKE